MWRDLQHKYVLPILGVFSDSSVLYMVTPWMSFGTIMDYIKKYGTNVNVRDYVSLPHKSNPGWILTRIDVGTRDR
jgi:serine/threonine protein kinase